MIWISTGLSRKDIKWKNVEITWSNLVKKLRAAKQTSETVNEYIKASKDRQGEIKDIGGYVGGTITGGRRTARSIQSRSLVTLDVDFPEGSGEDFFNDVCLSWPGVAMVMHSTHSSYSKHLRYRLIMPLMREVLTDEYEAVARYIAGSININAFDKTTFQAERLMFWPSISRGNKYEFFEQRGKPLDADSVLKLYKDWRDVSQWPMHEDVNADILNMLDKAKKQQDPLEKRGVIGSFCRTYSIHDVIDKYLSDVYEPCDVPDRYTFKQGSTTGGLVVYEDKYAYSHHSTDPVSGLLVNAFDLVRLSLYSDSDKKIKDTTNITKCPSYIKALELATRDKKVKKLLVSERVAEAREDFKEIPLTDVETEEETDDWLTKLDVGSRKGELEASIKNFRLILVNDKAFKDLFKFDAFSRQGYFTRPPFWRSFKHKWDKYINDADLANIESYIESSYKISSLKKMLTALEVILSKNEVHPVKEFIEAEQWDGINRLETVLINYLGAEDNIYTRTVTAKCLIAAVARIYEPGVKYDTMLIVKGKQGIGKSTLFNKLGDEWFNDTLGDINSKDTWQQLQGAWLVEMPELSRMRNADVDSMKVFVARTTDRFRVAFGRLVVPYPRQCVFIGTTNEDEPLKDYTGNRRFWPVDTDISRATADVFTLTVNDVKQIWAEALTRYRNGETLHIDDAEVAEIAEQVQEVNTQKEGWHNLIADYLNTKVPANWYTLTDMDRQEFLRSPENNLIGEPVMYRYKITVEQIYFECLHGYAKDLHKNTVNMIKQIMSKMTGWEPKVIKLKAGGVSRGWYNETNKFLNQIV